MSGIHFFSEEYDYELEDQPKTAAWLEQVAAAESYTIIQLNYIFCSDDYLLDINQEYLEHDYYTDVITFNHSEKPLEISGDIFISIDRVKENSSLFSDSFETELHRVMVHGLLHLIGYGDKSQEEEKTMRQKEEACLSLRNN